MKLLLSYAYRSMIGNWRRSLNIFVYIFFTVLILTVVDSFVVTSTDNMLDTMNSVLYGDVLVRSAEDTDDIFTLSNTWEKAHYLSEKQTLAIKSVLDDSNDVYEYSRRTRFSAELSSDYCKSVGLVIGIEPETKKYKKYLRLIEGDYLSNESSNGIILLKSQADSLKVNVGDEVTVSTAIEENKPVQCKLKVVGIGELDLMLSMSIAYIPISAAEEMFVQSELPRKACSEIVVFSKDSKNVTTIRDRLEQKLRSDGESNKVLVELTSESNDFIIGTLSMYKLIFFVLIVLLMMIVCILLINLIIMMGLERRQEIGTLRAIGFSQSQVLLIVMNELFAITIVGCLTGLIVAKCIITLIGAHALHAEQPLSFILGKEFYLRFDNQGAFIVLAIVLVLTMLSAYSPTRKAVSVSPVDILND